MKRLIALLALALASPAYAQTSSLNAPALSVSTSAAASSLSVSGLHTLLGFTVNAPAAGYVLVFDSATAPADGTVSPGGCYSLPTPASAGQSGSVSMANTPTAVGVANGITVVFSTTGCFTKTASATAFISILYQ